MTAELHHGDMLDVLAAMAPDTFDACVTDPPYHFGAIVKRFAKTGGGDRPESRVGAYNRRARGFMGMAWDGGDIAFQPGTWAAVLRVLKPGAHLLAFGGTRGFHRMACAIEDAGFEIRDTIMWLYGSGFPKSHNQHGEWEGWGTALKPAYEPIMWARKPLIGTVAANLEVHRTGAINIDGCRIQTDGARPWREARHNRESDDNRNVYGKGLSGSKAVEDTTHGRWPANVIHDGSDEVLTAFPDAPGQQGDLIGHNTARKIPNGIFGEFGPAAARVARRDSGSAARFFYCAKASKKDRDEGCNGLPLRQGGIRSETSGQHITRRDGGDPGLVRNNHPSVKPTELMRYLCRLVTPPGGTVLDPFAGSGSTGKAALLENFNFVGVEREAEYIAIARKRLGLPTESDESTDKGVFS